MGETVVRSSAATTSREVLDRVAAGPLHGQLVGEAARKFGRHPVEEIEEAFHEAYTRGLTKCSWDRDKEVYGWLRRTMINWAHRPRAP